jgi:branched-chain amino acid transport system substrate-binding protein
MLDAMLPSPRALALVALTIAGCSAAPVPPIARTEVTLVDLAPPASARAEEAPPVDRSPWKVGAFMSLSGGDDSFGLDTRQGIELGVDEVNAAGGAKGRKVSVLYEDDQTSTAEASRRVEHLIVHEKVVAVIGEVISARSRAGGEVANRRQVPLVVTASTHSDVTQVGPFVFRACFDDTAQARGAARYVVKVSGKKRVGVLRRNDDTSSIALARAFDVEVARLGGQIVVEEVVRRGDTDIRPSLQEIQRRKPDFVYAPVYWDTMTLVAQQGPPLGIRGELFVGSDGWFGEDLLSNAGDLLEGAHFTDHWAPDAPWPQTRAFYEHFEGRFQRPPTSLAALGYDAVRLVASALSRARDDSPEAVRDALQATRDLAGATGTIASMGPDREPEKAVVIVRISGHALHFETTVGSGTR